MRKNKLLSATMYESYEDSINHEVVIYDKDGMSKVTGWIIPNCCWQLSYASIIVDKDLAIKSAVERWIQENGVPAREILVFDVGNPQSLKFNPFACETGNSVKKLINMAYTFLACAKDVPFKENYFIFVLTLISLVYYGFSTKRCDMVGFKDTLNKDTLSIYENALKFFKEFSHSDTSVYITNQIARFLDFDMITLQPIHNELKEGFKTLISDEVLAFSLTQENIAMQLDFRDYQLFANLTDDKYAPTNMMFALFLDAMYDRNMFYSSLNDLDYIPVHKHFILDDIDTIPLAKPVFLNHIKENFTRGLSTTVISSKINSLTGILPLSGTFIIMKTQGISTDAVRYISEKYAVNADELKKSVNANEITIVRKNQLLSDMAPNKSIL